MKSQLTLIAAAAALATLTFYVGRHSAREATPALADTHSTASATEPGKQLWTCSMHPQVIQDHPGQCPICHMELTPVKAATTNDTAVVVDSATIQNMGVRTAPVTRGPLVQNLRVVGYLEEPEPLHRDINLRVSGWIEKLYADTDGMVITEGQPLFDLYSPELTVAIDELISARKQLTQVDSMQGSLRDAARRKLLQYGLDEKQVDALSQLDTAPRTVSILSPLSGHMTEKQVYEGAAVKAGDLVLRLASRHRMWLDAQVYEQQLPLISDGQSVRATLVSQPGETFEGKVLFVHPHIDPATRTALVRIEIANTDLHLRQGMYATVDILADAYHEALVVPREAVIDSGRTQVAFVDLGGGRFEPRAIELGLPAEDDKVEVKAGLREGERVVTSGQFLLDSESRMKEAIARFGSGEAAATPIVAAPPIPSTQPTAAVLVPHADDLVRQYLAIAQQLGARQDSPKPLDTKPLADLATMAAEHASVDATPLARAVADAANGMNGKAIDEQREGFLALSEAVIRLVHQAAPSSAVAAKLYVIHCPMAFDDKGADWLQDTDVVANPFYAVEMKRCGSVTQTIELGK